MQSMTTVKTLSALCLALTLTATGCKKKDDAGAAKPAETAPAAAGSPAKPAEGAPAAKTDTPAPAAGGAITIASDDDYVAKGSMLIDKLTEIFKADGTNCDKLADDVSKMIDDNAGLPAALDAYEKAHPDAKKKGEAASKDKTAAFESAATPAIGACKDNKKLGDAMNKLAPG